MELFKKPNIDFIGLRWIPIGVSVAVVIGSLAVIAIKGFNYSIEFTGGSLIQVSFPVTAQVGAKDVREALKAVSLEPEIQSVVAEHPTFILRAQESDPVAVDAFVAKALTALKKVAPGAEPTLDRKDVIGPVVGKDLRRRTLWAIVLSLFGIVVYVAYRFENPIWGMAGVLALFHDVIGVAGLFALLGLPIALLIVTALLTIAGFSINDTIVIFDRMREKLHTSRGMPLTELMNSSINETLSRTIITVMTVQIISIVLFVSGGPVLRDFALAMVVGNLLGTYSSIGVATPLVFGYQTRFAGKKAYASASEESSLKVKDGGRRRK